MNSPTGTSANPRRITSIMARLLAFAVAIAAASGALGMASVYAQGMSGLDNGGRGKDRKKAPAKTEEQKPKVDEKAYDAALKSVPDKSDKADPWKGVR
jgi:hypothetical protein